ncbi:MAG: TerD family protein [Fusobacteriaceae bacterium]|jgi:stress response protein SCP2|nr:TerD family protein [Fusobacteriaceae bacterium]
MSISLQKGQKISLTKESSALNKVIIGLGWDQIEQKAAGFSFFSKKPANIDCDASALLLQGGEIKDKSDVVYFGNLKHKSKSVEHMGDNLTGAGEGDDEQILVELSKVPEIYDKIVLVVNIYKALDRNQHFGMIKNAFIRFVDVNTKKELCKYNLTDDYSGKTAMIFGELYRHNGEWKFSAIGQGTNDPGLSEIIKSYS